MKNLATVGPLAREMFQGSPAGSFRVVERRSLTVHIEDPGMYDVLAEDFSGDTVPHAGRYAEFGYAQEIADRLNRIWQANPQVTATEVLAFARGS